MPEKVNFPESEICNAVQVMKASTTDEDEFQDIAIDSEESLMLNLRPQPYTVTDKPARMDNNSIASPKIPNGGKNYDPKTTT